MMSRNPYRLPPQILPLSLLVTIAANPEDLTIFALPFNPEQLFAISDCMFPARLILILISRAIGVDIFRTI